MSLDPWCTCEACTLRRELKRANDLVEHVANRLGHARHHSTDEIRQTFDFTMDRYEQWMQEKLAKITESQP